MVLSLVLVDLVDWDGGVNNTWLDGLLLDDWLDGLVDVVVNVLTNNVTSLALGGLDITNFASAAELLLLCLKTLSDVGVVTMLDLTVVDSGLVVGVLLWEDLLVLYWLDGGVVMILVNLTVNDSLGFLVLGTGNVLIDDSWIYSLDTC